MSKTSVTDIAQLIDPIIEDQGMELVDLEFRHENGGWILRLFIDQPGGVTLDDCADISGLMGAVLDVKEIINVPYILEVSSPGVNRPLRKEKDFERFTGQQISLKIVESIAGQKNFKGRLMGIQDDKLLLLCDSGQEVNISLGNVARAHVDYQWDKQKPDQRRATSKKDRR